MNSKLTLSIRQQVIEEAKKYAKVHGKSLSSIVEEYLKSITSKKAYKQDEKMISIVEDLKGSVRMPTDFKSYEHTLEEALIKKHLK